MNQALILNLAIIAVAVGGMIGLNEPLALLALFFMQDLPFGLLVRQQEEKPGRPIGFTNLED